MKAPSGSSGVSGDARVKLAYVWSVTSPCPPCRASAESSQTVPLNMLSLPAPLSVVMVTIVPAGEVNVMSKSPEDV
jgi:hypothetical protein